jgi:hypothetical protein
MANKALSEHVKAQKKSKLKEAKLQAALAEYQREQEGPLESRKGAQTIVCEHGIPGQYRTILNRFQGGRSIQEAHEQQQNMTPAQEITLVNFLEESAQHGFPQSIQNVAQYANLI